MDIVFDVGGVLLHWDPAAIAGQVFPDPDIRGRFLADVLGDGYWIRYDKGELTAARLTEMVYRDIGIPREQMSAFIEAAKSALLPKEDTLEVVRRLRRSGNRLFVLSNMPSEMADYIRSAYAFWDFFDGTVFSGYVRMVKPDEEMFHYLFSQYRLVPEQTVFIDDSAMNIEAAARLGVQGMLFQDADTLQKKLKPYLT